MEPRDKPSLTKRHYLCAPKHVRAMQVPPEAMPRTQDTSYFGLMKRTGPGTSTKGKGGPPRNDNTRNDKHLFVCEPQGRQTANPRSRAGGYKRFDQQRTKTPLAPKGGPCTVQDPQRETSTGPTTSSNTRYAAKIRHGALGVSMQPRDTSGPWRKPAAQTSIRRTEPGPS